MADALDVAVSAGEQDAFRWFFRHLVLLGDPDILQPDILSAGGPSEVKRIYEMAVTVNKPVMPHSPQAGINSMASLHTFSTVQNGVRPHEFSTEFSGPLDELAELYGEGVLPKDGDMVLSDRPGLGCDIVEERIAEHPVEGSTATLARAIGSTRSQSHHR